MASSEIRRIVFEFVGDASDLSSTAREADASLNSVGKSSDKAKGKFAAVAPVAKAAGVAAAAAAAKWAVEGVGMAEQAVVVADSFDKTFGPAAEGLIEDTEQMRLAMGLSEAELMKQATALGAVNVNLGQSQADAAEFSEEMIQMAADIAAFNGDLGQAPAVLDAMTGALAGSTESLDQYGINLTAAQIKQKALTDTGKESADSLTELEMRTAALALIQESATLQTGALEEQLDSTTTKQNTFNARMKDAQVAVGEALIPLKSLVLDVLMALLPLLDALAPILGVVSTLFKSLAPILDPIVRLIAELAKMIAWLVEQLAKAIDWIFNLRSSLKALRDSFRLTKSAGSGLSGFGGVFHSGGTVPGPTGTSVPIMAQGGEQVIPAGSARSAAARGGGSGGGMVVNVTINSGVGDPMEIGRQVSDVLSEYGRQIGGLDLPTREAS